MKSHSYILIALVILATSAPTLSLAQYEREDGQPNTMILTIFSLTLYVTISAILGVVAYSVYKVIKIRRKTARKRLA